MSVEQNAPGPCKCLGCRIQACEVEGNTATPCSLSPAQRTAVDEKVAQ